MTKYKLTDETIRIEGIKAYRIQAVKDFSNVKNGDLGGFVSTEYNLSHDDDCWIYDNAMSLENSRVDQDARLLDNSKIYNNAKVSGKARLMERSEAFDNALIFDNAKLYGNSRSYGSSEVFGNTEMMDMSKASHNAWVSGDTVLKGEAHVTEKTTVTPINVSGLYYNVTIMDDHIAVDCVTRTIDEWINEVTTEELLAFDGKPAVRFYRTYKEMLTVISKTMRSNTSNL